MVWCPCLLLVLPSTSGCFMRIRSPYLRVVLVVSVPAKSRSATVTAMLSKVYTGSVLCFSCDVRDRASIQGGFQVDEKETLCPSAEEHLAALPAPQGGHPAHTPSSPLQG